MKRLEIAYEHSNMLASRIGKYGARPLERRAVMKRVRAARKRLLEASRSREVGFLSLGSDAKKTIAECQRVLRTLPSECETLIVLGIGGSDLGAKAILSALKYEKIGAKRKKFHVLFGGNTTEPAGVRQLLNSFDSRKTCINIVSKSGGTVEPLSVFLLLREKLIRDLGEKEAGKRIIVTTDPKKSPLLELAKKDGYQHLAIPSNVGGRYSVLTACGIFPALAAGYDVGALLAGADVVVRTFRADKADTHPAMQYALLHLIALERKHLSIHVLMPYSMRLWEFSRWTRQLIAESLGKKVNSKGKIVNAGITPVASLGPEDQHSQLQLYAEGPRDKVITCIEETKSNDALRVPSVKDVPKAIALFGSTKFSDIVKAERAGTAEALRELGRPNDTIYVNHIDEASIGALFMFFEISVVLMGYCMDINPFDQPGVEHSKRLARLYLGKN